MNALHLPGITIRSTELTNLPFVLNHLENNGRCLLNSVGTFVCCSYNYTTMKKAEKSIAQLTFLVVFRIKISSWLCNDSYCTVMQI